MIDNNKTKAMISEAIQLRALKFNGYKIEFSENIKSKPVARLYKFITVGKNKGTYKLIEGYYFGTEERREAWVKEQIERVKKREQEKKERKEAKKSASANMVNPFKVGQVFYDSWGYDQTNIDFYQIIEVKAKSVVIREVAQVVVKEAGFMCEYVRPDVDNFVSEPMTKPVQISVGYDGKISYHLKSKHGWISEYDGGEKGVYQSHYA